MRLPATVALLSLGGCSVAFGTSDTGIPIDHRVKADCDNAVVLPIADVVLAVTAVALSGSLAESRCQMDDTGLCGAFLFLGGVGIGALFTASAIHGGIRAVRCEKVNSPETIAARKRVMVAMQLTNAAVVASRRGDCETVRDLEAKVKQLHIDHFHSDVFVRDADIRWCSTKVAASSPAEPHCFENLADGEKVWVCLPSREECDAALRLLPPSDAPSACVRHSR